MLQRRFGHRLRTLGEDRAHVPFEDRVPTEAQRREQRTAELERLRQQLVASGRLGRWAARQLDRAEAAGASRVKQRPDD